MRMPGRALALGTLIAVAGAGSAAATVAPKTRVVSCGTGDCLMIRGRRADASSAVAVNGHAVTVEGARDWQVRLPIETVRGWSVPHARTIEVSVLDREAASTEVDLPIGLLGHAEALAMLVVSAR